MNLKLNKYSYAQSLQIDYGRFPSFGEGNVMVDILVLASYVENYELIRRAHQYGLSDVRHLRSSGS